MSKLVGRGVTCGAVLFVGAAALSFACGSSDSGGSNTPPGSSSSSGGPGPNRGPGLNLPLLLPALQAVAPKDFGGTGGALSGQSWSGGLKPATLSSSDVKSRFFSDGPTDIFRIVAASDDRVKGINGFSEARPRSSCFDQPSVTGNITPWGQTVEFKYQCFQKIGSGTDFIQFGVVDDKTYLYVDVGAGTLAAIAVSHPLADGGVALESNIWMEVGRTADFGHGSYGVIQVYMNELTGAFEMSVAGLGFGFCGAQLRSDGKSTYATGSPDMGATCQPTDSVCGKNDDMTMAGVCDAIKTFTLPALGRIATTTPTDGAQGASAYPGGTDNVVKLDGTATDHTHFGPSAPSTGVGDMNSIPPSAPVSGDAAAASSG